MTVNSKTTEKPSRHAQSVTNIFWLAPVVVMAGGILPMPYGYYTLSKLVVCGCAVFFATSLYKKKDMAFVWVFGFLALLYNPIIPVNLYEKELWIMVNAITGVLFIAKRRAINDQDEQERTPPNATK